LLQNNELRIELERQRACPEPAFDPLPTAGNAEQFPHTENNDAKRKTHAEGVGSFPQYPRLEIRLWVNAQEFFNPADFIR